MNDLDKIIVGTVTVETEIKADDILSAVCGFLPGENGGSDYWIEYVDIVPVGDYKDNPNMPISEEFARGFITFNIKTDDEDKVYTLTLPDLMTGLQRWSKATGRGLGDFGDIDADDSDSILQYALFNEQVYS